MAKIEFEIDDNVFEQVNEFCSETGISKESLVNVLLKDTLKKGEIPFKISSKKETAKFNLEDIDMFSLIEVLKHEDIFIITVFLSKIEVQKAAAIIENLQPIDFQLKVAASLSITNNLSCELQDAIFEYVLKKAKHRTIYNGEDSFIGGVQKVVDILGVIDRLTEKAVIENLEEVNPDLAEEVKSRMFVFEDIALLDDRSIQRVLREVDQLELAKALKTANQNVLDRIFKNMSKRSSAMLKEEMEFMGPVLLKDVHEIQSKIVAIIRRLEDSGEVVISRFGDKMFV